MSQALTDPRTAGSGWTLGMVGLGVMGRNFLLNLAERGFPVAGCGRPGR
jgi:6-phosphogluconate dehydrogenase